VQQGPEPEPSPAGFLRGEVEQQRQHHQEQAGAGRGGGDERHGEITDAAEEREARGKDGRADEARRSAHALLERHGERGE
jgi:hypothetical protein